MIPLGVIEEEQPTTKMVRGARRKGEKLEGMERGNTGGLRQPSGSAGLDGKKKNTFLSWRERKKDTGDIKALTNFWGRKRCFAKGVGGGSVQTCDRRERSSKLVAKYEGKSCITRVKMESNKGATNIFPDQQGSNRCNQLDKVKKEANLEPGQKLVKHRGTDLYENANTGIRKNHHI